MSELKPFGLRDKISYLSGDLANDFTFILVAMFLMVFYTKVLGISGAVVGLLFLSARILDAFTDITMGRIVDNRKITSEGKFRYWIIKVAPFVTISGFLLFLHWVMYLPYILKIVYIFVTYILWGSICYTAINIPYGSMASVITDKQEERSSLSLFRSIGANIAIILISFLGPKIVYSNISGQPVVIPHRFTIMAGVFCFLAYLLYMFCYYNTVERIKVTQNTNSRTLKSELKGILKGITTNKPLLYMILIAILLLLTGLLTQGLNAYLFADYFKNIDALSLIGIISSIGIFILGPFINPLTTRYGKKIPGSIGLFIAASIYLTLFILKIKSSTVFLVFIFVASLGYSYLNITIWAYISDIIDNYEVQTGKREDGTVYAVYSFSRKIGQALAGGLSGFVLSMIGYIPSATTQSVEVTNKIYSVYTISGFMGYLLCGLVLFFLYPLSKKIVDNNVRLLKEIKENK